MMSVVEVTAAESAEVEEFAVELFMACLATMELANVELGVRLGLYEALAEAGPSTAAELARSAGIVERYAQEWLERALGGRSGRAATRTAVVPPRTAATPTRRLHG